MRSKIVVALGGNALGNTPLEQIEAVKIAAQSIAKLIEAGNQLIIVHGNGPQVGMINLAFSEANENNELIPLMPFVEATAMSQGYIGYHLINALDNRLRDLNIQSKVVSVISRVLVDKNDPAFLNPTKPVGHFYSADVAQKLEKEHGYKYIEDSGRGYRRVVPSPTPIETLEINSINDLLNTNNVVVVNGGGGIPMISTGEGYEGIDAVIDKDASAAMIAKQIDADILLILTAVDKVAINFNKSNQKWLDTISVDEAKGLISEEHFAAGSMLPKVMACISFVDGNENRKAIITSLESSYLALKEGTGTVIKK